MKFLKEKKVDANLMNIKANQQKAQKLINKYQKKLKLEHWSISLQMEKGNYEAVGECTVQCNYLKALISLWPSAFEKTEDLEHIIKHELCHILTAQTKLISYDLINAKFRTHLEIDAANEVLTEWIARII